VYALWVAIIHRGGRGSEIVVRKLRVGRWDVMAERTVTSRAGRTRICFNLAYPNWCPPLWRNGSGEMFIYYCNFYATSPVQTEGIPHSPHRGPNNAMPWRLTTVNRCVGCAGYFFCQVMNLQWNCLSFQLLNSSLTAVKIWIISTTAYHDSVWKCLVPLQMCRCRCCWLCGLPGPRCP
jgi:hypothetical protein